MAEILKDVCAYATIAHAGQYRKDGITPYIVHPIGVAEIVRQHGGTVAQQAAALLHDVPEDCEGYTKERIFSDWGFIVGILVAQLTNDDYDKNITTREQRNALDLNRLSQAFQLYPQCALVKFADIYYNICDLKGMGAFGPKFVREKQKFVEGLSEVLQPDNLTYEICLPLINKCRVQIAKVLGEAL